MSAWRCSSPTRSPGCACCRASPTRSTRTASAYLASARKYVAGRFADAVTAFWSPLYTWLLAVPLFLRVPPLVAAKLVDLSAGALALAGTWRLLQALRVDRALRVAAAATAIPVLLAFCAHRAVARPARLRDRAPPPGRPRRDRSGGRARARACVSAC